ncbi:MAG: hypothetical protein L6Q37_01450 [Bdellovibrionaceae bacterium]|nr:hypothetical protein [Pseudobdellovibrionaceae bacterium]NUM59859.1 hypothetical protein [Pseudobdellovibrionaceae bacterium]
MSLVSRRVSLLITVVVLTTNSYSQVVRTVDAGSKTTISAREQIAQRYEQQFSTSQIFRNLTAAQKEVLKQTLASDGNKTLSSVYKSVMEAEKFSKERDVIEISRLRMEIMTKFANVDIFDPSTVRELGQSDAYTIIRLVYEMDPLKLPSAQSKDLAKSFLEQLNTELAISENPDYSRVVTDVLMYMEMGANQKITIERSDLYEAISGKKKDAVIDLFKGNNDVRTITLGETGLEVNLSKNVAAELQKQAELEVIRLTHLAEGTPTEILKNLESTSRKGLDNTLERMKAFEKGNHLLDRKDTSSRAKETNLETIKTYDQLLAVMKQYNAAINSKSLSGKISRFFSDSKVGKMIPGSETMAKKFDKMDDANMKNRTIREKIEMVKMSLETSIATVRADNEQLNKMMDEAYKLIRDLQPELAYYKYVNDLLAIKLEQLKSSEHPHDKQLAENLEIHVARTMMTKFNAVINQVVTMRKGIKSFELDIGLGIATITQVQILLESILPDMYITETSRQANLMTQRLGKSAEAARKFHEELKEQQHKLQIQSMEKQVELAKQVFTDPVAFERRMTEMATAFENYKKGMSEAFKIQTEHAAKMTALHNREKGQTSGFQIGREINNGGN